MADYNLESIFVRFEQSPITDLQTWLSNDGKRPMNNDMFDTLNGIKNIREDAKEADTFSQIKELNQDVDLIEKPPGKFTNLDNLKDTARDELNQQYNNILINIKVDIQSSDTIEEVEEIVPRYEDANVGDKRQLGRAKTERIKNIGRIEEIESVETAEDLRDFGLSPTRFSFKTLMRRFNLTEEKAREEEQRLKF